MKTVKVLSFTIAAWMVATGSLSIALGQGPNTQNTAGGSLGNDPRSKDPGQFFPRPRRPRRPIVDASFITADQVAGQVNDNELVLGVVVGGQARAYPINMLTGPSREIINDTLGGRAIAATW